MCGNPNLGVRFGVRVAAANHSIPASLPIGHSAVYRLPSMSRPFIDDDFLLDSPAAVELYHRHAAAQPILDFHNHLPPQEIAEDKRWSNLTQLWLAGDHYKWRVMRTNGVPEERITGAAGDYERFEAFAAAVPFCLRNPIFHWCALELKRYFGIDALLSPATARSIWDQAGERLRTISARSLLLDSRVVALCTTDDPTDSLEHHKRCHADAGFQIAVCPAWRPDKGMAFDAPETINPWIAKLEAASGVEVGDSWEAYLTALQNRHDFFHAHGCRLSDHGIDGFFAGDFSAAEIKSAFANVRSGRNPGPAESAQLKSAFLYEGALMDHAAGWTQQFHFGPIRNTNSRLFAALGPDIGCDSIGNPADARAMARFFDRLDRPGQLAQTILYNIHPGDNEMVAAMVGNFQSGSTPGKMQLGSGWWFNDQLDGMRRQIEALSQLGLLSRFVGMLTDSRSFLSFCRHEYFRRLLCQILGRDIEHGLIPRDYPWVGEMVADICFRNARNYFRLPEKQPASVMH
jgi:glucuronate isomerase